MRYFLVFVLFAAAAASLWQLYALDVAPAEDIIARTSIVVEIEKDTLPSSGQSIGSGTMQQEDFCAVWGSFKEANLAPVRNFLQQARLTDKAQIVDRYRPDRWIVYLPAKSLTAVRAFAKQFRQQGRKVVLIKEGPFSPGVEIASFATEEEARAFMEGPKAPNIGGLRAANSLGGPSGEVDFIIRGIDEASQQRLAQAAKRFPSTKIVPCGER